jgi:NCS1 family nucleobase:cation symporter-1
MMVTMLLACIAAQMIGVMGQRHGVPFPVLARVSFGIYGAYLPALARAVVAVAWYGIQTYLASRAVIVLAVSIAPGLRSYDVGGMLGLSELGWSSFMLLWVLQLIVLTHGMERIRKFQNYAGAVVSLVMVVLAVIIYFKANGHIDWNYGSKSLTAGERAGVFVGTIGIWFSMFVTLLLNFCDFSRFSTSTKDVLWGNVFGLLVNGFFFASVVVVVTVGGVQVYGHVMTEPTEILAANGNRVVMAVGATLFILATIGVNVIANAVSPAYDFSSIWPNRINFTRGAMITAVLSVFVMPWKLYSSPVAINDFLGGAGALLGPVFGVMMVDYFLIRRGQIDVKALYSEHLGDAYQYDRGLNRNALIAMLLASIVSVSMVLVPSFAPVMPYSWITGVVISGFVYISGLGKNYRGLLFQVDKKSG